MLTSHLAGSVFDNVANVARHVFRNIQRVLDGHPLPEADLVSGKRELMGLWKPCAKAPPAGPSPGLR